MNIHSFRQEFVAKQLQVQYTIQLHCKITGSVVQGYRYNIQVQVKVHCSGTVVHIHSTITKYKYSGTGTLYRYTA